MSAIPITETRPLWIVCLEGGVNAGEFLTMNVRGEDYLSAVNRAYSLLKSPETFHVHTIKKYDE